MLLGSTRDIAEAFEAAVGRHVPSRPSGAERDGDGRTAELPMLWLHYLHWAAQVDDASGVVSLPQLLRRCLLDFCGAPAGVDGKASVAQAVGSGLALKNRAQEDLVLLLGCQRLERLDAPARLK